MWVSEADRVLLNGGFDEIDGIDSDRMWLLKHLPHSWRLFGLYYLKMGSVIRDFGPEFFAQAFRAHTGSSCTRRKVLDWVKYLAAIEIAAAEAVVKKDMVALSKLKLPTKERRKQCLPRQDHHQNHLANHHQNHSADEQ